MYKEATEQLMQSTMKLRKLMRGPWKTKYFSLSEIAVMLMIQKREAGMEKMGELCKELEMTKPALTQVINKLVDDGMVERIYPRNDRRIVCLQLTPLAVSRMQEEKEVCEVFVRNILEKMGEGDMRKLTQLFEKLYQIVKEERNRTK